MASITLIIGEDDWLVSETAGKQTGDGAGLEVFDSVSSSNAELQLKDLAAVDESFSTPPFLEPVKVTWWKNVHFLPHSGKGAPSKEVKEALEKFAEKVAATPPAENQKLVISGPSLLSSSIFAKTLEPVAEFAVFQSGKPWEAARAAVQRAEEFAAGMNLRFDRDAAGLFVSRVGSDSRSLMSELSKMRDYLGPGAHVVDAAAIDAISSPGAGVEPELRGVTDAIGERDLEKLLCATARFERESGFAVFMTTVIEKFFRGLLEYKDAAERGEESSLGLPPYAMRKNAAFASNWTLLELRVARARFLALREKAVSAAGSIDVLVIAELVRLCRARKGIRR
ncbi:MAG: hypothetical protein K6F50_10350 [Kiritimatiellae bacterium]|nr:hypothetical protein [Kiritimatiellia bacterium]